MISGSDPSLRSFVIAINYHFGTAHMPLKLRQGQVWKHGHEFIRIVRLERLEVAYKTSKKLRNAPGEHHVTSKKDFCRLLKECRLLSAKSGEAVAESAPEE
jgi:hypothetical protein